MDDAFMQSPLFAALDAEGAAALHASLTETDFAKGEVLFIEGEPGDHMYVIVDGKVKLGQTTADGAITLEAAYCLGNCALSPAVMVDDKLVGRVDAKKFETIVAECRS